HDGAARERLPLAIHEQNDRASQLGDGPVRGRGGGCAEQHQSGGKQCSEKGSHRRLPWRPAGLLPALKANVVIAVPSRRLTAYAVVSGRLTGGEGQARELPALSDQICFNSTASPRWIAASAPKRRAAA